MKLQGSIQINPCPQQGLVSEQLSSFVNELIELRKHSLQSTHAVIVDKASSQTGCIPTHHNALSCMGGVTTNWLGYIARLRIDLMINHHEVRVDGR